MSAVKTVLVAAAAALLALVLPARAAPTNVILLIGDGMGTGQVQAARCYLGEALSFESFPQTAGVTTYSVPSNVTDSAAGCTAIATGHKVYNGTIAIAQPGDGRELETLLEFFKKRGRSTGILTTSFMTDATPAGFGAHESSRGNTSQIANDYLSQTRPDVLMGGGGNGMSVAAAQAAGYTVVTDRTDLLALDTGSAGKTCGIFGNGAFPFESSWTGNYPHLSEMAVVALQILDNDPDGFFIMIESGKIDVACHGTNIVASDVEVVEFSRTVSNVLSWAEGRTDTLIMLTADHETGGLVVLQDNGAGNHPTVQWTSAGGHTSNNVTLYATGTNAHLVTGILDNTDLFRIATDEIPQRARGSGIGPVSASQAELAWDVAWGEVYTAQRSADLVSTNWQTVLVTTSSSAVLNTTDTDVTNAPSFFYRCMLKD